MSFTSTTVVWLAGFFMTLLAPLWVPLMLFNLLLWFNLLFWCILLFMGDIWTLLQRNYRGAFQMIACVFLRTFRQNNFLPAHFLPFNFLVGCLLLHKKQTEEGSEWQGTTDVEKLFEDRPQWMSLKNAKKFMEVAMAMYGGKFVIYRNFKLIHPISILKFYLYNIHCFFRRPKHLVVEGDFFRSNLAGLLVQSRLQLNDIFYASFADNVFQVPFCVAVDHETESIVIAIRGSRSFNDFVTDFTANSKPIFIEGREFEDRTHKGMWNAAIYVASQLEISGILEEIFHKYPKYNLVVTGHSLGAGTSVLLGIRLRMKFNNIKVYAFSCPGWLVNESLAELCKDFVFTIGLGDDIVLRAGINSCFDLVDNAANELKKKTVSIVNRVQKIIGFEFIDIPSVSATITETIKRDESIPQKGRTRPLFLPGHILHIRMTETTEESETKKYLAMRWAKPDEFREILVMPRMFKDHLAQNVMEAIETVSNY